MKKQIIKPNPDKEYFFSEGCFILELSNTRNDPDVSIARARVQPGVTTHLHRLRDTVERYVIIEGTGWVEIGESAGRHVFPYDVVIIPSGCPQRITNTGQTDLVFLAICSPRFIIDAYDDLQLNR